MLNRKVRQIGDLMKGEQLKTVQVVKKYIFFTEYHSGAL